MALLPPRQRFDVCTRLDDVFSMTADNLPLLGPVDHAPGMWVAQALWVTDAAGSARCLVQTMTGQPPAVVGLEALRPDRFATRPDRDPTVDALRLYDDIYATA
jgi:glycine/D-amino acid oxidase-like deaminating enzyme